ncbi:N(4)-(beta-N-acetylglucosaminyl)-L-asparaginase [Spiroplasma litorale]|uniref:N(4)-(Beta-N-acetylglucosaminyl)-L-asparaginase n=1 Tax=Spiroplasma litorale TaxID=216942 RepID=A0A0K1W225_9MOLU|nr:N(4)-(beta-N-acetylglucosaminyl)-L-asparaginase [Spiroplasma litorale]AKX34228.1 N(4)-(beta-N-acetylglucosaminyl)-L-asparaginase [Spiroplasma litorale]
MKYAFIGTWRMSFESIKENINLLKKPDPKGNAIVNAISYIEDFPYYKSVGYGGLPNEECDVELDAGFMNGNTFQVGAIAGVKNVKNPIKLARELSYSKFNSFLVGKGAEEYAKKNGFEIKDMLSERAIQHYELKIKKLKENPQLSPYDGHDTVGMVSLDVANNMFAATSTSGLFMKKPGRVGDSPIAGSGFYCVSSIGGATATGLGEDILKGCLSFQVVEKLKNGISVKDAPQQVVKEFNDLLNLKLGYCGAISIVALDKDGNWGVGTNCEFSFVVGNQNEDVEIYIAKPNSELTSLQIEKPSKEWLENYDKKRRGTIE